MHVQAAAQELVGVLIFSALPFTVVQGLADSEFGKSLQVHSPSIQKNRSTRVSTKGSEHKLYESDNKDDYNR